MRTKEVKLYSFKELEALFPEVAERLIAEQRDNAAMDGDLLHFAAEDIKGELAKVFGPFGRKQHQHFMSYSLGGHSRGVVCEGIMLSGSKVEEIRAIVAKDPGCIFDCGHLPEPYEPIPDSEELDGEAFVHVKDGGRYNALRYERTDDRSDRDVAWCEAAEKYLDALHEKILDTLQAEYDYLTSEEEARTRLIDAGEVFTEDGERE